MYRFVFSIFSRFYIAFSSFIFFIVSAKLFGTEGRGVIAYTTSIFSFLCLVLSFNLGRAYFSYVTIHPHLKKEAFTSVVLLNVLTILVSIAVLIATWFFSETFQKFIDWKIFLSMLPCTLFYTWNINNNSIFAVLGLNLVQEKIMIATRTVLLIFLISLYLLEYFHMARFLLIYSLTLSLGSIIEIFFLRKNIIKLNFLKLSEIIVHLIKESFIPHLDFLAFNLFQPFLMIVSGFYLSKQEIGITNFSIQLINFIFLFSVAANIRSAQYSTSVGYKKRIKNLLKLFWGTATLSTLAAITVFFMLIFLKSKKLIGQFEDANDHFLLLMAAIPGFLMYQILNPIILEMRLMKKAMSINVGIFLFAAILSPYIISIYKIKGIEIMFAIFYLATLGGQYYLLSRYILKQKALTSRR